jgi:Mannosyl-glycoprotein endo-beta-N-acetylglucosaminidase
MSRDTQGLARRFSARLSAVALVLGGAGVVGTGEAQAGTPPEIRMTTTNRVPACVTPERLMAFLGTRNTQLNPKFATIAATYRSLGEPARVRWDYAFFQMVLETNYLMFKRGDGTSGDVGLAQNNFAGIGATGGGVPGDRFVDVKTGVLAQIQHLTAYSGEKVAAPVATRTRERQDDIIEISRKLGRPVTFGDLAKRWAVDRSYARNIEFIADQYRERFCAGAGTVSASVGVPAPVAITAPPQPVRAVATANGKLRQMMPPPNKLGAAGVVPPEPAQLKTGPVRTVWRRGDLVAPAPQPAVRPVKVDGFVAVASPTASSAAIVLKPVPVEPVAAGALSATEQRLAFAAGARALAPVASPRSGTCQIHAADLGGAVTVLVRADVGAETRLTALTVEVARAQSMTDRFIAAYAPGGVTVGTFDAPAQAIAAARMVCQAK